jgi:hypothetical protein
MELKKGWTATAHETILETMEGFLHTDPERTLLKKSSPAFL